MNKKQIVNENLSWPEVAESTNEQIIKSLESSLKKFTKLKRRRRPRQKKLADAKKTETEVDTNDAQVETILKAHFKIGINSITKTLERQAQNVLFVLVCRSCKPLNILTRHIQVMCALAKVPAACVHNLSTIMTKQLNVKTVSALLVLKFQAESKMPAAELVKSTLDDWSQHIVPLIPPLKNPFVNPERPDNIKAIINEISGDIARTRLEPKLDVNVVDTQMDVDVNESRCESEQEEDDHFGANFLKLKRKNDKKYLTFDSDEVSHFILFNDDYAKINKT